MEPTNTTTPVYADGKITCGGVTYHACISDGHLSMYGKMWPSVLIKPAPGEVPRPVRGGFLYANYVFLPHETAGSYTQAKHEAKAILDELRKEKEQAERASFFTPSIPPKLEHLVVQEHVQQKKPAEIVETLKQHGCHTSPSSVRRLIRQFERTMARAKLMRDLPAIVQELGDDLEEYDEAKEDLRSLKQYALQQVAAGAEQLPRSVMQAFRLVETQGKWAERRLRTAYHLYEAHQRMEFMPARPLPAEPPPPKPKVEPEPAPAATEPLPAQQAPALASAPPAKGVASSVAAAAAVLLVLFGGVKTAAAENVYSGDSAAVHRGGSPNRALAQGRDQQPTTYGTARAKAGPLPRMDSQRKHTEGPSVAVHCHHGCVSVPIATRPADSPACLDRG